MDKGIQATKWWLDIWHERTSPLDQVLPTGFGRRKGERNEGKKEKKLERERVYLLSRFLGDRSVESRRNKKQSWSTQQGLCVGTGIVEFQQLREVGVFSYLDILCLKGHENGFGCCEAGMAMDFCSK